MSDTDNTVTDRPPPTRDSRGRWVKGIDPSSVGGVSITSANAHEMHAKRLAKKHATIRAAAQAAVESPTLISRFGKAAWLAEIAQVQHAIATTPDAPAATRAASWLVRHAGLDEIAQTAQAAVDASVTVSSDHDIVAVILRRRLQAGDVVDASCADADTDADDES